MDTIDYNGYKITIKQDEIPESPREWDNLGTMVCFHREYTLGDKHNYSIEDIKEIAENENYVSLPLFLYDHGGITMNTSGFSCQWDSGQVGIIFVSKEKILKEFSAKKLTKKLKERVIEILKGEVKTFDQYLTGDIYGFIIEKEIEVKHCNSCNHALNDSLENIESVWGFYGYDTCLDEAKSIVDNLNKKSA